MEGKEYKSRVIDSEIELYQKTIGARLIEESRGHRATVNTLEKIGLVDAYHYVTKEEQGNETKKTFYLYRKPGKGFPIDHCFVAPERILDYQIPDPEYWLEFSDHIPCILSLK